MSFTDDTSAHGLHIDFHLTVLAHLGLAYSRLGPKALLVGRLIIVIHLLPGQHGQLESQREGLIGAIESSHIPAIAVTAGYDSILARITIYETCLIPRVGHPFRKWCSWVHRACIPPHNWVWCASIPSWNQTAERGTWSLECYAYLFLLYSYCSYRQSRAKQLYKVIKPSHLTDRSHHLLAKFRFPPHNDVQLSCKE